MFLCYTFRCTFLYMCGVYTLEDNDRIYLNKNIELLVCLIQYTYALYHLIQKNRVHYVGTFQIIYNNTDRGDAGEKKNFILT